jgi:hypothetical protein
VLVFQNVIYEHLFVVNSLAAIMRMAVQFDILPMIQQHSTIPIERLRVLSRFDDVQLGGIRRGVIFVFAAWSGPAVLGFKRFTQMLSEFSPSSLDLVVLDADCLNAETATQLFGTDGFRAGGYGETIWVRDGVITAREVSSDGAQPVFREHTRDLLNDHAA